MFLFPYYRVTPSTYMDDQAVLKKTVVNSRKEGKGLAKDSFIKGTIILALAAFVARFLGLVQRVPLKHLLEDTGMATYGIAYNVYFVLLIVATAGIPSALSKLISERTALGQTEEAGRIFRAAVIFALAAGVIITAILYAGAPFYAEHISQDSDATLAIRALAPAMLLFPLIAIMRGYFQGIQVMRAGGLSQIIEQIARVITAVGLAYALLWFGYSHEWAVAGASFGGVTGAVGALAVMLYFWRKHKREDLAFTGADKGKTAVGPANAAADSAQAAPMAARTAEDGSVGTSAGASEEAYVGENPTIVSASTPESTPSRSDTASTAACTAISSAAIVVSDGSTAGSSAHVRPLTLRQIYAMIFRLSIPISLISIAVPFIYVIDSSTVIALLQGQIGYDSAKETLGLLAGRAQSIAGIPPILAIALSMSIVPVISSAYARNDMAEVKAKASLALRISVLSGLPLVLLLSVASNPINGLLFGDEQGTWIIALMTIGSIFQIMMMTSGAILMGFGKMKAPMVHVFIGLGIKLAGTFVLAPWFGIYGIIIATALCFVVTMQLNLISLKKLVSYTVMGQRWMGLVGTTVVIAAAGLSLGWLGDRYIHPAGNVVNYGIQSIAVGCAVLLMYPLLLMLFRVVTQDDIHTFPVPLQKVFNKLAKIRERKRD